MDDKKISLIINLIESWEIRARKVFNAINDEIIKKNNKISTCAQFWQEKK